MSVLWAERQRRTNYLVRKVSDYLFKQPRISADQLYGLSQLTWITSGYTGNRAPYIKSCKIPAFERIFQKNYRSIEEISIDVSRILHDNSCIELINSDTGFTGFYNAYRNSALDWTRENLTSSPP